MSPNNFIFWLQGFLQTLDWLDQDEVKILQEKLKTVQTEVPVFNPSSGAATGTINPIWTGPYYGPKIITTPLCESGGTTASIGGGPSYCGSTNAASGICLTADNGTQSACR